MTPYKFNSYELAIIDDCAGVSRDQMVKSEVDDANWGGCAGEYLYSVVFGDADVLEKVQRGGGMQCDAQLVDQCVEIKMASFPNFPDADSWTVSVHWRLGAWDGEAKRKAGIYVFGSYHSEEGWAAFTHFAEREEVNQCLSTKANGEYRTMGGNLWPIRASAPGCSIHAFDRQAVTEAALRRRDQGPA